MEEEGITIRNGKPRCNGGIQIWESISYSQQFLTDLIPKKERKLMDNISNYLQDSVVVKKANRGSGGRADPNISKTVRVTINREGKSKRVKIYIGSEICDRLRWIIGDRIQVKILTRVQRGFSISRADASQQDAFMLGNPGGKNTVRKALLYVGFSYQQPFPYVEKLTTAKIIAEDSKTLVCQIP
jgi:hypothetical protein